MKEKEETGKQPDKKDKIKELLEEGNASFNRKDFIRAINFYDEVIAIDQKNVIALTSKGSAYANQKNYPEALKCYESAISIDNKQTKAWLYKGLVFLIQNSNDDVIECFCNSKIDLLNLIVLINIPSVLEKKQFEVLEGMLNNNSDNFFTGVVGSETETDFFYYKQIYIQSLKIIRLLHVNHEKEKRVAHYTRRNISKLLLFKEKRDKEGSRFRLSSITNSNDPKEGVTLLDYLNFESNNLLSRKESYRAFGGCFTFNHNCLNQFRLYGKQDGNEATGVSLVMKNNFFSSDIKRSTQNIFNDTKEIEEKKPELEKQALYRCIYLDPESEYIISIGHREEYTFYRDKENEDSWNEYKDHITGLLKEVRDGMKSLKEYINNENLDKEIIGKLLIHLRYLVKHVAFKEEQECRIIRIESLDHKDVRHNEPTDTLEEMYIDYLDVRDHVDKIWFAPKATGIDAYQDRLLHERLTIECRQCDHPLA